MVAGAFTPTEVWSAYRAGADMVRVYPCGALGGPAYLRCLRTPFPEVPLIPAGGVTLQTASEFISAGAAALEVESDLVDLDALRGGRSQRDRDERAPLPRRHDPGALARRRQVGWN